MRARCCIAMGAVVLLGGIARAASVAGGFAGSYVVEELGAVPGLPVRYGGLTMLAGDSNTLLIGGLANTAAAGIYQVGVVRDGGGHITGFSGNAAFYASAFGGAGGGIDGGLMYGPGGVLFFTSFPDNMLGQIAPGESGVGKTVALTGLGYSASVGAMSFMPTWLAGYDPNRVKLVSYDTGEWFTGTLVPAAGGFYEVTAAGAGIGLGGKPEGITYVKGGNAGFATDAVLVSEFGTGTIAAYDVDGNGDPIVGTRREFVTGLAGAFGAMIDPVTGDFLFSTFGATIEENRIVAVRGFAAPPDGNPVPVPSAVGAGIVLLGMMAGVRGRRE